ncbi:Membrane protein involved in the export of O-antigen, teichoic acid lipoteichoic acids [Sphingobacterium faecium PCAi_F2.5]|nr:Membrane protein involved in the export of O-antigen, teichoic acid lipoteichoic acids [Sphingobacterium faecium PCAi_F2.5]
MGIKQKLKQLLSSDLNRKIFNHSLWIIIGNVVSKFILLLATIFIARYLGKEEYGQFGIIKSTILMFAMFAGLELGMTATKYISQYRLTDKSKVERIVGISNLFALLISLLVSIAVFVFAKEIATQIKAPKLSHEIRISSFILFFSSLNGIQNGILTGIEKFKQLSINNAVAGIVSSLLLVFTSRYFGLDMVVMAFGLNYVLLFFMNYITLKKEFYSTYKIRVLSRSNFVELPVLWKFSLPAILAGLMIGPVTWLCNYLLVNQPNGYSQMANFDIASQWRNTILFIPAALSQITLPLLSSSFADKSMYKEIFNKNLRLNIYSGGVLVFVFVLGSPLITYFYGDKYSDALVPIIIMFITTGFLAINNVIGQAIASQGKMWLGLYVNLLWAIVLILSAYFLVVIYDLGAVGLSLSYLVSYIIHTFVQFIYIKRFL